MILLVTTSIVALLTSASFTAAFAASLTGGNHKPIMIQSNSDFTAIGLTTECGCVVRGTGTSSDPFIIGPWTIMATSSGPGVLLNGTGGTITKFFTLIHITVHGTKDNDGIDLVNVNGLGSTGEHFDSIQAANIDGARIGIFLRNTAGVTVTGNSLNNDFEWGVKLDHSHHNKVTFMTVSHDGRLNPDSNELPESADVFLGSEFFGGILLLNSDHNVLSRSQLSEDAYAGFVLLNSDHNTIADIHSRYPDYLGGVLQDSSHNKIDTIDMQTADFNGLVVRGGCCNEITHSDFSANGPIGNEWNAHVVPYFISGLYLGWGTHDNIIKFNHSNNGNTGPGLLVDSGAIFNPIQSPVQGMNPLNNASGNDPGTVPAGSAFDAGVSTAAGSGNIICGNTFASSNLPISLVNSTCPP